MNSPFDFLSQELLEHIVERVQWAYDWHREYVMRPTKEYLLRPGYQSQRMLQAVFKHVHFSADPKGYGQAHLVDPPSFAKHVEAVMFVSPACSTALTFEVYEEIVLAQEAHALARANDIWTGYGSYAYEDDGHRKRLKKHLGGKLPMDGAALRAGFEKQKATATKTSNLLQSEELRNQWAFVLRNFQNCHTIRFPEWQSIVGDHKHDQVHFEGTCRRLAAPMGELLFAAAVDSLARAGTTIRKLSIQCAVTGSFGWDRLPNWAELDLSHLETLKFEPSSIAIGETLENMHASEEQIGNLAADTLAAIMRKCKYSLITFHYGGYSTMNWPGTEIVPLPRLQHLILGAGLVRSYDFRRWMQHMPALEHLELHSTRCSYEGYKLIFDAIKDHMETRNPKRMLLEIDQIPAADWAEITLCQELADLDERILTFAKTDMDPVTDIDSVLIRYMTGLSGWNNASTQEWFDNDDEEDAASDGEGQENDG